MWGRGEMLANVLSADGVWKSLATWAWLLIDGVFVGNCFVVSMTISNWPEVPLTTGDFYGENSVIMEIYSMEIWKYGFPGLI